jgi:hypothetical protein
VNWKIKGFVTLLISILPFQSKIYSKVQQKFGRYEYDAIETLSQAKVNIQDIVTINSCNQKVFELGSGIGLIHPLYFSLFFGSVTSVDVDQKFDLMLFRRKCIEILDKIDTDPQIKDLVANISVEKLNNFRDACFDENLLERLGITYISNFRVAGFSSMKARYDVFYSNNTLEHIPVAEIKMILEESKRILNPGAIHLHRIDFSDHFSHIDQSISSCNFLKYSDRLHNLIAGNQFTYHNRLRVNDFIEIFESSGYKIIKLEKNLDLAALRLLDSGFKLDKRFVQYKKEDLATQDAIFVTQLIS